MIRQYLRFVFILAITLLLVINVCYANDIYISDCSVLDQAGSTYYLIEDINDSTTVSCIKITAENITLDCQGHRIAGNYTNRVCSHGIHSNQDRTTIKNCIVTGRHAGIHYYQVDDGLIQNNTVNLNMLFGIKVLYSNNIIISKNTVNQNMYFGIHLFESTNNVVSRNTANLNGVDDIWLFENSDYNTIFLNNFITLSDDYSTSNTWNSPEPITYIYNGNQHTNHLGNYWDNYNDIDADNDGVWDNFYSINPGNQDNYPLREPFENYQVVSSVPTPYNQQWKSEDIGYIKQIEVDDVDSDGTNEIIVGTVTGFASNTYHGYIYIFNALTHEVEWQSEDIGIIDKVIIADLDSDGRKEIIAMVGHHISSVIGNRYGYVYVFDGVTHEQKWKSSNIGRGGDLVVDDLDGDGTKEIIAGAMHYYSCTRQGHVYVFDGANFTQKWKSEDVNSLDRIVVTDIDDDGTKEIIFGNRATDCTYYIPGHIHIFDGINFTQEWKSDEIGGAKSLIVNDVDDDGIKELITHVDRETGIGGHIYVFDGKTHVLEWKSSLIEGGHALKALDIDNDGTKEIISRTQKGYVYIFNGKTHNQEWKSDNIGEYYTLEVDDIDTDSVKEILTFDTSDKGNLCIFNGITHEIEWQSEDIGKGDLAVADIDNNGEKEILAGGGSTETYHGYLYIFGVGIGNDIPTCSDGEKNGDETDVDCGGSCPPCEDGCVCNSDSDCLSEYCDNSTCLDTLNNQAASFVESVVGAPYLWGGKGWDYSEEEFVDGSDIKNGYFYWNSTVEHIEWGHGLDCSGLSFWSYNKASAATKFQDSSNPILYEGANRQWTDDLRLEQNIDKENLKRGDLLFLIEGGVAKHVIMYVGNGYVVHAEGVLFEEIVREKLVDVEERYQSYGYTIGYGSVKFVSEPKKSTMFKSGDYVKIIAEGGWNIRSEPKLGDEYILVPPSPLPKDSEGQILEHEDNGIFVDGYYWWYVQFGAYNGWCAEDGLEKFTLGENVKGIDVSHYQGDINWSQVYNAGYRFAFAKATGGTGFSDNEFEDNMIEGRNAGMLMGAYHFAYPEYNDPVDEAHFFVSVAEEYLKEGYLIPVLDIEDDPKEDSYPWRLGKEALSNWIHDFVTTVESETGVQPIIYVNKEYAKTNHLLDTSINPYHLWIAHWICDTNMPPDTEDIGIWDNWDFWQYWEPKPEHCGANNIPGIGGDVDRNIFNGDMFRLNTFVITDGSVITSPLEINPIKDIHHVGDELSAKVTLTNKGKEPITFDALTVGGRLNGWCPTEGCPDFTHRSPTLQSGESYQYEGSLTLTQSGNYHFFIAYYIENPTPEEKEILDENNWNTNINLGAGLTHADRIRNIIVLEEESSVIPTIPELRNKIDSQLQQKAIYPPYLLDPDSFTSAVSTLWSQFTSWATQTDLTEKYDELYMTGIAYDNLRLDSLIKASDSLNEGDITRAQKYLEKSYTYDKLSAMGFGAAAELFGNNIGAGEILAEGIKDGCESAVSVGVAVICPAAAVKVDAFYMTIDYAIDVIVKDKSQADKNLITKGIINLIFKSVKFKSLEYDTLETYVNKVSTEVPLDKLIMNEEFMEEFGYELKKVVSDRLGDEISEEVVEYVLTHFVSIMNSIQVKLNSPGELRVYGSQGQITGLINKKVKHEISMSVYNDETVTIFLPFDTYRYEVIGTDNGTYGLEIISVEDGNTITFNATEIPTAPNVTHQYTINWTLLAQGARAATIQIDSDGDGAFEQTVTAGSTFHIDKSNLTYTGNLSTQYSDPTHLSATLTKENGDAVPNKTITFTFGTQTINATTDENGTATTTLILNQTPNNYTIETTFAGDDYYIASGDSDTFEILKEDTTSSTPYGKIVYSDNLTIHVTLYDNDGQNLFHQKDHPKLVYLQYFNRSDWINISEDTLNSTDNSNTTLNLYFEIPSDLDETAGIYDLRTKFDGDDYYNPTISDNGALAILKEDVILSDPSTTIVYSDSATVTITMHDNDNEDILHQPDEPKTIYLEYYDKTNWKFITKEKLSEGKATFGFSIPENLDEPAGAYLLRVRFNGYNRYNPSKTVGTLIILKENVIISVSDKVGFTFDNITLEAEIRDNDGNILLNSPYEVNFNINNEIIGNSQTDENGKTNISWNISIIPENIVEIHPIIVNFAGNEYYKEAEGQGELTLKSPKWLKNSTTQKLENAKTDDKVRNKDIDIIIRNINKSLENKLWMDASHLNPKNGTKVFHKEHTAAVIMHNRTETYKTQISVLVNIIKTKQDDGLDTSKEKAKLNAINTALPVFEEVIHKLVKTDELLAKISIQDARNLNIDTHQIEKAETELEEAYQELESERQDKAIKRFENAWKHAQLAMEFLQIPIIIE